MKEDPATGPQSFMSWLKNALTREPQNLQELVDILRNSEARNLLDPDVLAMVEGALHVSNMQVRDIMVPRIQMIAIDNETKPEEIISIVLESGHSRFPVIAGDANDVIGILLAKDLLAYYSNNENEDFNIKDMMRRAVFIPESKRLNVLLREFRSSRNHMAIVVDEYGVAGLVTIEDVIEEIVGEIEDEHDIEEEEYINQHGKSRYTVKALTPIDDFNKFFRTNLSDDEYETIGGLVINAFGHLPKRGEMIDLAGYNVKVLRSDKRRVHLLRLIKLDDVKEPD
ncbi:MAG: CBS domain-containing protein [Gammaproteobacteria bacterium]|nr:CBS domain-containing protein [Gammaproteobacteria bacterium]